MRTRGDGIAKRQLNLPWGLRRYFLSTSTRRKRSTNDDKTSRPIFSRGSRTGRAYQERRFGGYRNAALLERSLSGFRASSRRPASERRERRVFIPSSGNGGAATSLSGSTAVTTRT